MSNRNFDASQIPKRVRDQNVAQQLYGAFINGRSVGNPQTLNANVSVLSTEYYPGVQTTAEQSLQSTYTFSPGGIANYIPAPNAGPTATVPGSPTIDSITPGDTIADVNFTTGSDDGSPIINYEYSTDNGSTFISTGVTSSPFTIIGLTNGVTYSVVIRAVNSVGSGASSNMVTVTPVTVPSPPTGLSATPGNTQATISFTPGSDGGSPITNYKYSTDGSTYTALSPTDTSSPITITGLTNGVTYSITLKAVNAIGDSVASTSVSVTPITIETFTTIGTTSWTAPIGITAVEYLVVGGGGGSGGGYDNGGGAGGGGGMVLTGTLSVVSGNTYTITVGDGGAGGVSNRLVLPETRGISGENSVFSTIVSLGGGGGYPSRQPAFNVNGNGGSSAINPFTPSNPGNGGGGNGGGGGGGGSSRAGSNRSGSTGGSGGSGTISTISGSSVTYGIGGGGGNGRVNNNADAGTSNTGNGARGGGATSSDNRDGAKGGSGIVILKY